VLDLPDNFGVLSPIGGEQRGGGKAATAVAVSSPIDCALESENMSNFFYSFAPLLRADRRKPLTTLSLSVFPRLLAVRGDVT
jgi:hypothetical protein